MHDQLAQLRRMRDATADPNARAALEMAIRALEKEAGILPEPHPDGAAPITIGAVQHSTGVAIGPGARATVYNDGRQGQTHDGLLAAYYQRLAQRCRSMPLQGIDEQRSTSDSLAIDLERVYTQLATPATTERERLEHAALELFDASAFLKAHTGADLLPAVRRTSYRAEPSHTAQHHPAAPLHVAPPLDLERMQAADLTRLAQESTALTFLGPQLVSEAIAAHPRLVLLGEPGSGKSTALRYLAFTLAQAGLSPHSDLADRLPDSPGRMLPIFAPLLPLAQRFATDSSRHGDGADLWDYLVDQLQPKGANAGLAAAVHAAVEAGRVILLLDGLDEVAGVESRRKVVRAVQSCAARSPTCRIVVTCRIRAYEGERNSAWQLPGWPTATLDNWTLGQMRAFVRAWYATITDLRGRTRAWCEERITSLTRALTTREDLRRFGRQPLVLTVMALVHLNDGRLPEERASLYGRCIDMLLGQWEIAGKEARAYGTLMAYLGLPAAPAQRLRPLRAKAAYEAHRAAAPGRCAAHHGGR